MSWRAAKSLNTLLAEINQIAPGRSKAKDGSIGDPAHAARCSRHNPNDFEVVCARDFTHDPAGGFDAHATADRLVKQPHPELDYIISRGRTASRRTNWRWHVYKGTDPHDGHIHVGVGEGTDCEPRPPYDSTIPWGLLSEEDDDMAESAASQIARWHEQYLGIGAHDWDQAAIESQEYHEWLRHTDQITEADQRKQFRNTFNEKHGLPPIP